MRRFWKRPPRPASKPEPLWQHIAVAPDGSAYYVTETYGDLDAHTVTDALEPITANHVPTVTGSFDGGSSPTGGAA